MKFFIVFTALFLFAGGVFSANAMDLIILRDGTVIEAQVIEISPTEIRYRRFDHLDGPVIVIPVANVLSIRYASGRVDTFNVQPMPGVPGQQRAFAAPGETPAVQGEELPLLIEALNRLPAIPIGPRTLSFQFTRDSWTARASGRDFLQGTFSAEATDGAFTLTLTPTHTSIRNRWVITPSPTIVLEYRPGPPPSFSRVSRDDEDEGQEVVRQTSTERRQERADAREEMARARQERETARREIARAAPTKNNWVFTEFGLYSFGLGYERMLAPWVSLGANFYWGWNLQRWIRGNDYLRLNRSLLLCASLRFYPGNARIFFFGFGLGYYSYTGEDGYWSNWQWQSTSSTSNYSGLAFNPEMGLRMGGRANAFYAEFGVAFPFSLTGTANTDLIPSRTMYVRFGFAF